MWLLSALGKSYVEPVLKRRRAGYATFSRPVLLFWTEFFETSNTLCNIVVHIHNKTHCDMSWNLRQGEKRRIPIDLLSLSSAEQVHLSRAEQLPQP